MTDREATVVTGLAWYRRDQWSRLKEAAVDSDALEPTYEEWLDHAQNTLLRLIRQGLHVRRVDIDVEEVIEWCKANRRPFDGRARAEFTSRKVRGELGRERDRDDTV